MDNDIKTTNKAMLDMAAMTKPAHHSASQPRDVKSGKFTKPKYLRSRVGSNVPFGAKPTQ